MDSLPLDLQIKWRDEHRAEIELEGAIAPAGHDATAGQAGYAARASCPVAAPSEHEWRLEIIRPALAHRAGSPERRAAVAAIAGQPHPKPGGRRRHISERMVRVWLANYEARGMAGLVRRERGDRGGRRCLISRTWDREIPFDQAVKERIAADTRRRVRSLWAQGAPGWRHVQRMAAAYLVRQCRAAGAALAYGALRSFCAVSRAFVERERRYAIIAVHDQDAKRFNDKHVPRIRRVRDGMLPMEVVVGDVHHLDILFKRDDGSICTPKAIAWHDVATNRIFVTVVFLEKGKGIRMEHAASSFIDMTQHPEWGVPGCLYLDNGGEYGWAGFVDDVMRLQDVAVGYLSGNQEARAAVRAARRSMVIHARPYNAPAKTIEGAFAVLEGGVLRMLPGWIGGDRMVKKTANVGRAPEPFPGSADDFRKAVAGALDYYHTSPQSGHLEGKSPCQALAGAMAAGWKRVDIDRHGLEAVFARETQRKVSQGAITVSGETYIHRELGTLTGTTVTVRVPLVGDRRRLPVLDDTGNLICIAEPAPTFAFLDAEGAREQARRHRELRENVSAMRRDTDDLDLFEEMAGAAALHPKAPDIPSAGIIRLSDEFEAIATARRQLPAPDEAPQENEVLDLWRRYKPRRVAGQD